MASSMDFRRVALALPEAKEKAHFGKADFRVRDKIFATLPDAETGVIKLSREQQEMLATAEPEIFAAVNGGWGRQGWTKMTLAGANETALQSALQMAWRNVAPKNLQR